MAGVCGVFALICALCIIISVKRHLDGPKKLKKICAKESGYKVEEVENFEHQALDLDSQAISLLGTVASVPRSPVWL